MTTYSCDLVEAVRNGANMTKRNQDSLFLCAFLFGLAGVLGFLPRLRTVVPVTPFWPFSQTDKVSIILYIVKQKTHWHYSMQQFWRCVELTNPSKPLLMSLFRPNLPLVSDCSLRLACSSASLVFKRVAAARTLLSSGPCNKCES